MKKLMSLILAFAMILSLAVPAMAIVGGSTIYFQNTLDWETVYAYAFNGEDFSAYLGEWPGTAMTPGDDTTWSIEVPAGADMITFNNGLGGEGNETDNLTIPTDGGNMYDPANGWSVYTPRSHRQRQDLRQCHGHLRS